MTDDSKQTTFDTLVVSAVFPKILWYNEKLYEFDPRKVIYGKPSTTETGGQVIKCEYPLTMDLGGGKQGVINVPIELETPAMLTTWGISSRDYKDKTRTTLDVAFSQDASPSVRAFHDVMKLWDQLLLAKIKENRATWFTNKKVTNDILEYLFNTMVRTNVSSEGKVYADSFRCNIQSRGGKLSVEVYDIMEQPIEHTRVTGRSVIRERVYQTGIWFSDQTISSSFSVKQVQLMHEGDSQGFGFAGGYDDGYPQPAAPPTMSAFGNEAATMEE